MITSVINDLVQSTQPAYLCAESTGAYSSLESQAWPQLGGQMYQKSPVGTQNLYQTAQYNSYCRNVCIRPRNIPENYGHVKVYTI